MSSRSFGEALHSIGLYGTSRYNPDNLQNNCVFVSMAYLLGINSNQLAESIKRQMPDNGRGGVSNDQTFDMLTETRRMIDTFNPRTTRHGPRRQEASTVPITSVEVHQWLNYNNRANGGGVAVGYTRDDSTGHCVTVRKVQTSSKHPNGLKYICYQQMSAGLDVTWDAEDSELDLLFMFTRTGYRWMFTD